MLGALKKKLPDYHSASLAVSWALFIAFSILAFDYLTEKYFAIDEFLYVKSAWFISHGYIPYRDFFEHHFPLIYQLHSNLFFLLGDSLHNLNIVRLCMSFFVAMSVLSIFIISNNKRSTLYSLVPCILFISNWKYLNNLVEIRPDVLGLAFFLTSIAILKSNFKPQTKALVSGISFGLCLWSTQKALIYGAPLGLLFIADFFKLKKGRTDYQTASPLFFISGVMLCASFAAYYLYNHDLFLTWFRSTIVYHYHRETSFGGLDWYEHLYDNLKYSWWVLPFFIHGLLIEVKGIKSWTKDSKVVLIYSIPSTFLSYSLQSSPYAYSLLPLWALVCIFSGKSIASLILSSTKKSHFFWPCIILFCLGILSQVFLHLKEFSYRNTYYTSIYNKLEAISEPQDCVHDFAGTAITRRSSNFYYYTNGYLRGRYRSEFEKLFPKKITENSCTIMISDFRTWGSSKVLDEFFSSHFVRVYGDIWLWGKKLPPGANDIRFHSIKDGSYYIHGNWSEIDVDGKKLNSDTIELDKGIYNLSNKSKEDAYIIWLPRNAEKMAPLGQEKNWVFSLV